MTGGGPYRVDQTISLAFASPGVGRLVAHGSAPFDASPVLGDAIVPETIAVTIVHPAEPYQMGDSLTLSFVDPRVARIHRSETGNADPQPRVRFSRTSDLSVPQGRSQQPIDSDGGEQLGAPSENHLLEPALGAGDPETAATASAPFPEIQDDARVASAFAQVPREHIEQHAIDLENAAQGPQETAPVEETLASQHFEHQTSEPATAAAARDEVDRSTRVSRYALDEHALESGLPAQRMTERGDSTMEHTSSQRREQRAAQIEAETQRTRPTDGAACAAVELGAPRAEEVAVPPCSVGDGNRATADLTGAAAGFGVHVRLHWSGERVRRFMGVVDKLFTVGRLGWYRHTLAMRLLVPDEVTCYDALGDVEAMRHLHALRAAAVETLGRPLLTAFMPNFSVSAQWLATIDSIAAVQALAGLRDAIVPYVDDEATVPALEASWTVGAVERRELLGASAASVEALLPVLIPTTSPHVVLTQRLCEYRRMLIDVFGQTARSAEIVRVNAMAQTNHALDDRLWQLVGAVGEAFDGLAVA